MPNLWHKSLYPSQSCRDILESYSLQPLGKGHQSRTDPQTISCKYSLHFPRSRNTYHTLQEAIRPRQQHLSDANPGSHIPILGSEVSLKHPSSLTKPRNQLQIT